MKARTSILSLAIVSLFAAGTALAYGPGPQAGKGPRAAATDPAQRAEQVQTRLNALKEALKLQPGQVDAWNAYEARVTAAAQSRTQMRQSMMESGGDAQAMADQRVEMLKQKAAAAEEVNDLRKALVATLTPEQKATFDQYAIGQRYAGRPGAAGVQRGPGPGYGPGAGGGRGPGLGRGGAA